MAKIKQGFMTPNMARKRSGQPSKSGMNQAQGSPNIGSLEDIDAMEGYATRKTVMNGEEGGSHALHKGYDDVVYGTDDGWKEDGNEPKGAERSANRDNGWGIHYGAQVDYFGPDTDYRAEEINVHHYGRDYEPAPFKDLFKTEEKAEECGIRLREEYDYSDIETPGTIGKSNVAAEAHGAINYAKVKCDIDESRTFKDQQRFRRTQAEVEDDRVATGGLDTKYGKDMQ